MAAIVYLDIDDEITSAAARLRTLEDDRIAMVLPLGSRLATSRINFRLLAREAEAHHKVLEIVTGDASARALAASAGLPTHVSVAAFEGRPTAAPGATPGQVPAAPLGPAASAPAVLYPSARSARPRSGGPSGQVPLPLPLDESPTTVVPVPAITPPRTAKPVPQVGRRAPRRLDNRMLAVILALVVLLGVGAAFGFQLLPSATVKIVPAVDRIGPIQLNVTAQPGITSPDPSRLLVPAVTFKFDLDVSDTFPTTGVKVDETAATGQVTFANCDTTRDVTVPVGALVATDAGIEFRTLQRASMKKAHVFPPDCPGDTVTVAAVVAGLTGNVSAGAVTKPPPGSDPSLLLVRNESPISGGTHTETKQVAQADVDAAMTALNSKLAAAFDEKIAAAEGVPAGVNLFTETKSLGTATPTTDPATLVGTNAESFPLELKASGTIVGADPGPVRTLAEGKVRSAVKDGFNLVEDSIKVDVGTPIVAGSTITFPVIGTAVAIHELDISVLRARIHGLGLPQARTVLGEYGAVTISVWPDWVTTIPSNDSRLSFTISAPPEASSSPGGSSSPGSSGAASAAPSVESTP